MQNKITNIILYLTIIVILFLTVIYFYIDYKDRQQARDITNMKAPAKSQDQNNNKLTPDIISKHNNVDDCWLIIDNKVLNVTTFIGTHPGGRDAIIQNCGKDASQMFHSIRKHAKRSVDALIQKFTIGDVGR